MTQPLDHPDHPESPQGPRRPSVLLFDVNETLSDMSPMAGRFEDVGAPGHLAKTWFAGLLRDGFALTVAGTAAPFARIGEDALRTSLGEHGLTSSVEDSVAHIMGGFRELRVHDDVPEGIRALSDLGIRLVTLSNGSASVAQRRLEQAGLRDHFEQLLSVEDAGIWKPAPGAYTYALKRCGVRPVDAMLIAVHPWDTDGAARAGLGTTWINRGGATYPGYFTPPGLQVTSLVDLADRLR